MPLCGVVGGIDRVENGIDGVGIVVGRGICGHEFGAGVDEEFFESV